MSEQAQNKEWRGNTEGTTWMHRTLIRSFKVLNLRFVYLGMAVFAVPFYMLFAHQGYITMYHYFRRRHGYGVWKSFRYVYINHYRFGQVILDRFASYAGRRFQFEMEGYDLFETLCHSRQGFVILSCHLGNYELAGYTFEAPGKRYNALVYSGEAETVMANRNRMLSSHNIRMISVGQDMSHVFKMSEALDNGEIMSIPADRIFGSPRHVTCNLLGAKARFPLGPYALALQRGVPTIAIFVMKESAYKYKVYIRKVEADDRPYDHRHGKAENLAQHFVQEMETMLKKYPEQWFNYYDFWNEDEDKA